MSLSDEQVQTIIAETRRHFEIVGESLRGDMRLLAERHVALRQEIGELRGEIRAEFVEVRAMIKLSYSELDRRLTTLEVAHQDLESRVRRLEAHSA